MADDAVIRDLQARLRRLEDLEEIRRLYLDYGMSLDAREAANYASLFSSDAKLRLGPVMKGDGPKEIEQAAREMFSRTPEGGRSYAHILNAPQIELDGDKATGECIWLAVNKVDGQPQVSVGRHVDELVRENGRWRFAKRKGLLDIGVLTAVKS